MIATFALKKAIPKPSSIGGPPCTICIRMERLRKVINRGEAIISKSVQEYKEPFLSQEWVQAQAKADAIEYRDKSIASHGENKAPPLEKFIQNKLRNQWGKKVRELTENIPTRKRLDHLIFILRELGREHPKCIVCLLLFGEEHEASPTPVKGVGDVCQWCFSSYRKRGLKALQPAKEDKK